MLKFQVTPKVINMKSIEKKVINSSPLSTSLSCYHYQNDKIPCWLDNKGNGNDEWSCFNVSFNCNSFCSRRSSPFSSLTSSSSSSSFRNTYQHNCKSTSRSIIIQILSVLIVIISFNPMCQSVYGLSSPSTQPGTSLNFNKQSERRFSSRIVTTKYGALRGFIVDLPGKVNLQPVEVFLGKYISQYQGHSDS